jgi:hypothetical protein
MVEKEKINKTEITISQIKKSICSSFLNKRTKLKLTLIILLLSGIFLNCMYGFGLQDAEVVCLEDKTHILTDSLNKYLHENPLVSDYMTIISSLFIDIMMISICLYWVFYSESWRFLFSLFVFYILRAVTQGLFIMRAPEGLIWNHPGLPSLAVSYLKTTDFFFSGHVGLPIIVACEFFKNDYVFMAYFSLLSCLIEFIVMTIMRGHYIIDLIFGITTAHYVYIIVEKYIHIIDDSSFSLKNQNAENNHEKKE